MKKNLKRLIAVTVLLLLLLQSLFSLSVEDMFQRAKENSSEVRSYERTKENTLLLKSQSEIKGTSVSVQSGVSVSEDTAYIGYPEALSPSSSVSIVLPEIGDGFFINTGVSVSRINLNEKAGFSVTPSLSLTKNFSIKSFEDTRSNMEDSITRLRAEYAYQSSMTSFENSFYQSLISILNASLSLEKAQRNHNRSTALYERQLKAGFLVKDSLPALQTEMSLESSKALIDSTKANLESLLSDFKDKYGMDYEMPDEVRKANLEMTEDESLSTSVSIASLSLEGAKQDLYEHTGHTGNLKATASATPVISFDKDYRYVSTSMNASVGASYTDKNWTISATVSDRTDFESPLKPVLTISGKWSNSSSTSKTDEITEKRLTNVVLERQADLDKAVSAYASSAQALKSAINEYRQSETQNKIACDYHSRTLEMTQRLYDSGMASEESLEDALFDVRCDSVNTTVLKLQALILENRIKLLNL